MDRSNKKIMQQSINQPINRSDNQSTNQSDDQSINQSDNQSINRSDNQSTNQSDDQSINQSDDQSINQSDDQSTRWSINQSIDRTITLKLQGEKPQKSLTHIRSRDPASPALQVLLSLYPRDQFYSRIRWCGTRQFALPAADVLGFAAYDHQ